VTYRRTQRKSKAVRLQSDYSQYTEYYSLMVTLNSTATCAFSTGHSPRRGCQTAETWSFIGCSSSFWCNCGTGVQRLRWLVVACSAEFMP